MLAEAPSSEWRAELQSELHHSRQSNLAKIGAAPLERVREGPNSETATAQKGWSLEALGRRDELGHQEEKLLEGAEEGLRRVEGLVGKVGAEREKEGLTYGRRGSALVGPDAGRERQLRWCRDSTARLTAALRASSVLN